MHACDFSARFEAVLYFLERAGACLSKVGDMSTNVSKRPGYGLGHALCSSADLVGLLLREQALRLAISAVGFLGGLHRRFAGFGQRGACSAADGDGVGRRRG